MTGNGYVWLVTQQTFSGVARNYVPQGEMLDIRECVPVDSLDCGNYNPGHNCWNSCWFVASFVFYEVNVGANPPNKHWGKEREVKHTVFMEPDQVVYVVFSRSVATNYDWDWNRKVGIRYLYYKWVSNLLHVKLNCVHLNSFRIFYVFKTNRSKDQDLWASRETTN